MSGELAAGSDKAAGRDAHDRVRFAITAALIAVAVGLHVGVLLWRETVQFNFPMVAARDGQLLSCVPLLGAWLLLGPGWLWVRFVVCAAIGSFWFFNLNVPLRPPDPSLRLVFWSSGLAVLGLTVSRLLGWHVKASSNQQDARQNQFSLRGLVLMITIVAALIGVLEALRPMVEINRNYIPSVLSDFAAYASNQHRAEEVRLGVLSAAIALTAVAALFIVLRPGSMLVRSLLAVVCALALGLYLSHLAGSPAGDLAPTTVNLTAAFLSVAAICGLTVLPLQAMGYRLVRLRSAPESIEATSAKPLPWAERAAALVILGAAIVLALAMPIVSQRFAVTRRYYGWLARPTSTFARWARGGDVFAWTPSLRTTSLRINLNTAPAQARFLELDLSPAETPLAEPTGQQRVQMEKRLQEK